MGFHLEIISTNSNIISSLPSFSNIIRLFYKVLLQKSFVEIEFLLYITQCIVDYSRQCKTQIVIGFIVSSRLICLELVCTLKISGGEYNLKDSGLIHALEPVLFLLFLFEFRSCVRVFFLTGVLNGGNFRRWQKKMHFLLSTLKIAYVLDTPRPEENENESVAATRERQKWDNADYMCMGHILNGLSDGLFDTYQNDVTAKELWGKLEARYMTEDVTSKKFLVSRFNNYQMVDGRSVMEQFRDIEKMLNQFKQYDMKMDEMIVVSSIIDRLPPSWKDFKRSLKH